MTRLSKETKAALAAIDAHIAKRREYAQRAQWAQGSAVWDPNQGKIVWIPHPGNHQPDGVK